jgi:ribose transport system substrate-binding protein
MDRSKSKANVEDTLVKVPDIGALVGLWSYNGPLIADAVKAAGKKGKVKVICFDEDWSTLSSVRDGTIQATVVQKPFEFGYQSVKLLSALARGDKVDIPENGIIDTGVMVINKDNVDEFEKTLRERIGK